MHFHLNVGHLIKKVAKLVTAGVVGFASGGLVGAGAAMSAAVVDIAKDGLLHEGIHHLKTLT